MRAALAAWAAFMLAGCAFAVVERGCEVTGVAVGRAEVRCFQIPVATATPTPLSPTPIATDEWGFPLTPAPERWAPAPTPTVTPEYQGVVVKGGWLSPGIAGVIEAGISFAAAYWAGLF